MSDNINDDDDDNKIYCVVHVSTRRATDKAGQRHGPTANVTCHPK